MGRDSVLCVFAEPNRLPRDPPRERERELASYFAHRLDLPAAPLRSAWLGSTLGKPAEG